MSKQIRVMRKRPGEAPEFITIDNTLEALQAEVGGYIETITIAEDVVIICDEEGKLKEKPHNCRLFWSLDLVGTIVFAGRRGTRFSNVPLNERTAKMLFHSLWSGTAEKTGGGVIRHDRGADREH